MKTIEYRTIDKSSWPRGEWDHEPDKRQWQDEATGLPCLIVRQRDSGHLCGYVGVPKSHALHGRDYGQEIVATQAMLGSPCNPDKTSIISLFASSLRGIDGAIRLDCLAQVHGGLTFADKCQPTGDESRDVCHVAESPEEDGVWWFGFDCMHCDDMYGMAYPGGRARLTNRGTYRTFEYVAAECADLAAQLKQLESIELAPESAEA